MLTSLLGIRLVLWLGSVIPLPAPVNVSSALSGVEVTNDAESGDGFQMTFTLAKEKGLEYGLLLGGSLAPFTRVVLGVVHGAVPEVLIDGVITHHQLAPSNEPGQSTLTVTGRDISVMLDLEEKNEKYENQPDSVIFTRIVAGYAQYGLVPQPSATTDIPIMLYRIPRQHETDLRFIQRMARRNGFVFYIEPVSFGVNRAYFGPESRLGLPQPALSMNMGASTNVRSLSFSQDALAPVGSSGGIVEPFTKMRIPIPPLPSLKIPPLASAPIPARRTRLLRDTANQNPTQGAATLVAAATNAPDAVTGDGELDTVRYGAVLRARKLVGVRGVGLSYDGNYYVSRVTHVISRGAYTQRFTLRREGVGSLVPVVRP
ncbi:MAG: hypothetical protein H0V86_03695 [Chloroflexia bacterium]|nr:hypothetical protein [Chloroflexia bacterium]